MSHGTVSISFFAGLTLSLSSCGLAGSGCGIAQGVYQGALWLHLNNLITIPQARLNPQRLPLEQVALAARTPQKRGDGSLEQPLMRDHFGRDDCRVVFDYSPANEPHCGQPRRQQLWSLGAPRDIRKLLCDPQSIQLLAREGGGALAIQQIAHARLVGQAE